MPPDESREALLPGRGAWKGAPAHACMPSEEIVVVSGAGVAEVGSSAGQTPSPVASSVTPAIQRQALRVFPWTGEVAVPEQRDRVHASFVAVGDQVPHAIELGCWGAHAARVAGVNLEAARLSVAVPQELHLLSARVARALAVLTAVAGVRLPDEVEEERGMRRARLGAVDGRRHCSRSGARALLLDSIRAHGGHGGQRAHGGGRRKSCHFHGLGGSARGVRGEAHRE